MGGNRAPWYVSETGYTMPRENNTFSVLSQRAIVSNITRPTLVIWGNIHNGSSYKTILLESELPVILKRIIWEAAAEVILQHGWHGPHNNTRSTLLLRDSVVIILCVYPTGVECLRNSLRNKNLSRIGKTLQCVHVKLTKTKCKVYTFLSTFFRLRLFFSDDYLRTFNILIVTAIRVEFSMKQHIN